MEIFENFVNPNINQQERNNILRFINNDPRIPTIAPVINEDIKTITYQPPVGRNIFHQHIEQTSRLLHQYQNKIIHLRLPATI